ncbi:MAG: hypothetical protein QG675_163 [Patescibacteria group bacterium]|nr:hypothetical protein [Patescibacteria group bacterium]
MLPTKRALPMKVKIHYATVGGSGGMLTLTEDASAMPRLPEVGENITIEAACPGGRKYLVESIDWEVQSTNSGIDTIPRHEFTMNIRCQAVTTQVPTQQ